MKPEFPPQLGLSRLEKLAEINPTFRSLIERKNFYFHIVGTNGKGSLSSSIAQNLRWSGKKVGLFTSPDLCSPTERIRINGVPIPSDRLENFIKEFPELTYFEAIFAAGIFYFENCDYVVLEAGLGGRLDATNLIRYPLFVGVTSISFDHEHLLGDTLEKIALEKLAVVKDGPCYAYEKDRKLLTPLEPRLKFVSDLKEFTKVALETAKVNFKEIKDPIWTGRFHFVNNILIDGCHNPDGVEYFKRKLRESKTSLKEIAFCGLKDKKPTELLRLLGELNITIHVIPNLATRSMNSEEAFEALRTLPKNLQGEVLSLAKFIELCNSNRQNAYGFVGSLYGIGALLNALEVCPWCP